MNSFQSIFLMLQCIINVIALFAALSDTRQYHTKYEGYAVIGLALVNITLEAIIIFGA